MEEFYEEYAKLEYVERMVERHREDGIGPIIIDLDIKQKNETDVLTKEIINKIIEILTKEIQKICEGNYECYVLKRKYPYKKDEYYKNGLHIYYPSIVTRYEYQYYLREEYMPKLEEIIGGIIIDPIEEVYDSSVIKGNGLMMYRSSKNGVQEYEIYEVYNGAQLLKNDVEYLHKLSIRNKTQESEYKIKINKEKYNEKNKKIKIEHVNEKIEKEEIKEIKIEGTESIITSLLEILPEEYRNEYEKWIKMTIILKNNEKEYKKEWNEWSKKGEKYNKERNEKIWKDIKKREEGLTIRSLHWIVRKINIKEYNKIMEEKKREEYKNKQKREVKEKIEEIKDKYDPRYKMEIKSIR